LAGGGKDSSAFSGEVQKKYAEYNLYRQKLLESLPKI